MPQETTVPVRILLQAFPGILIIEAKWKSNPASLSGSSTLIRWVGACSVVLDWAWQIARQVIEQHGGHIAVASKLGEGTLVTIRLKQA
jgi:hypothetical protein